MPEHSIVFCLCNSVGAFIGRPPSNDRKFMMKINYINEIQLPKNNVAANRVLPSVCVAYGLHAMRANLNKQFMLYQNTFLRT